MGDSGIQSDGVQWIKGILTGESRKRLEGAEDPAFKETAVSLIFPRCCPVCQEIVQPRGELICPQCVKRLSPVRQPVCLKCGKEVESSQMEYCFDCTRHSRSFERNFALLNYNEMASISMAAIKYKNKREFLDFYGQALYLKYGKLLKRINPDVIVPVPVHRSRKRIRGFNQAEILAEKVGRRLGIPVCPEGLKRIRKTAPQKLLDPSQRLRNLEQAFGPGRLPDDTNTVLLVDDIYTTGSTMEACTRILKSMGIEKVYGLTICVGAMR